MSENGPEVEGTLNNVFPVDGKKHSIYTSPEHLRENKMIEVVNYAYALKLRLRQASRQSRLGKLCTRDLEHTIQIRINCPSQTRSTEQNMPSNA